MNFQEIQAKYISKIPKFPIKDPSAEDIYSFYQDNIEVLDIEPINMIRFHRKFKQFVQSEEENICLNQKFKEISILSQKLFDLCFPVVNK